MYIIRVLIIYTRYLGSITLNERVVICYTGSLSIKIGQVNLFYFDLIFIELLLYSFVRWYYGKIKLSSLLQKSKEVNQRLQQLHSTVEFHTCNLIFNIQAGFTYKPVYIKNILCKLIVALILNICSSSH